MTTSKIDRREAHRFFSALCFNRAWDLIRKPDRSDLEGEQILLRSQASRWHWTERADCTPKNLSIAHWQLSRVHALLGHAKDALDSARTCLRYSEGNSPFFVGYAHEALARSAAVAGDKAATARHLADAAHCLAQVADERDSALLRADLQSLEGEQS